MVANINDEIGNIDKRQKVKKDGMASPAAIAVRQTKTDNNNAANLTKTNKTVGKDVNSRDEKTSTSNNQQEKVQPKNSVNTASTNAPLMQNTAAAAAAALTPVVAATAADAAAAVSGEGKSPKTESETPTAVNAPNSPPVVIRLRQKGANRNPPPQPPPPSAKPSPPAAEKKMQLHEAEEENHNGPEDTQEDEIEQPINGTAALIQRTMGSLYEASPDMEDNTEEIRKLDSQLDHLNEYMDKVEERLKTHSEKLMETLKQQKEEREKRRRSFHERLDANRQEDDDFQRQLSQILNRVDISLKRQSACEITLPPMPEPNAARASETAKKEEIPEN